MNKICYVLCSILLFFTYVVYAGSEGACNINTGTTTPGASGVDEVCLSAYRAAQSAMSAQQAMAEQQRAAAEERDRLGREAYLRAQAEAAATRKQPTKAECKAGNLNTRQNCMKGAEATFKSALTPCNYYLWMAGGAGVLAAGTSETVAGGLGFGSAAATFTVKAATCQQAVESIHNLDLQACANSFDEFDLTVCEKL